MSQPLKINNLGETPKYTMGKTMNTAITGAKIFDADKYPCEGFMQSDAELEIVTDAQIQVLIKSVHKLFLANLLFTRRGK